MIKLVALIVVVVVVLRPVASLNVLRATAIATDVGTRGRCHPCDYQAWMKLSKYSRYVFRRNILAVSQNTWCEEERGIVGLQGKASEEEAVQPIYSRC
ncbi:hypothetical protein CI102_232 [Trichoderma harzianum]|nr:hypothetical protein CI102_232 [Trichoderma harzianum]